MPLRGVKLFVPPQSSLRLVSETLGLNIAYDEAQLAGLDTAASPDLFALMNKALMRAPLDWIRTRRLADSDLRFEATADVIQYMAIQAIRMGDVLLGPAEHESARYMQFRGIPIEIAA